MTQKEAISNLAYGINMCELTKTTIVHITANTARKIIDMLKEQERGWISINDRLPEVDKEVLVLTNGCIRVWSLIQPNKELADVCWEDDYGYFQRDEGIGMVTHWMPLPEPPKEE